MSSIVRKLLLAAVSASLLWMPADAQNSVSGNAYTPNLSSLSQLPAISSGTLLGNAPGCPGNTSGQAAAACSLTSLMTVPSLFYPNADNTSFALGNGAFGLDATTTLYSVAVGTGALATITSGAGGGYNTALGYFALNAMTTGYSNTAVGGDALYHCTTCNFMAALGDNAGRQVTSGSGSTYIGHGSGGGDDVSPQATTGGANTGIGGWTLQRATSGNGNFAGGPYALTSLTTGQNNIGIGYGAIGGCAVFPCTGSSSTGMSSNVAIGHLALQNDTASNNVAIGYEASNANTSGSANVAAGYSALLLETTGSNNTALGFEAAGAQNGASQNTAVGYQALLVDTTGGSNTAVGSTALIAVTTGASNVSVGQASLNHDVGGSDNTAVGTGALFAYTGASGGGNVGIGRNAGSSITSGATNIAIGYQPCHSTLTTGSNNICIGNGVDTVASGTSNEINIGGLLFYNNASVAAPAVTACGTSPAIDAHANNRSGTVTVGTVAAASCTVTFAGSGYNTWNHCRVTSQTAIASFGYSYTKTVLTVTGASLVGDLFDYDCDGY